LGLVREVGGNVQHLSGRDVDLLRFVLPEPEAELALEDVRQLLVLMLVARDDATLLEEDLRDHHPLGRDQATTEVGVERLTRRLVPPVVRCAHREVAAASARRARTVARCLRYAADAWV